MEYIHGDSRTAASILAKGIIRELIRGKRVLWLICGGSNISISVEAFEEIKAATVKGELKNLYITLTDERYGPVGHPDSNWQQLLDAGFDFALATSQPVLNNLSLEETVVSYEENFKKLLDSVDIVVGQFGIGADGHIAGNLPHSPAVEAQGLTAGYEAGSFTRLTLTLNALREIDMAYAFVFGETKREAVTNLKEKNLPLIEQPAQILKEIEGSILVTDIR